MIKYALPAFLALSGTGTHAQSETGPGPQVGQWSEYAIPINLKSIVPMDLNCETYFRYANPPLQISVSQGLDGIARLYVSGQRLKVEKIYGQELTIILSTNPGIAVKTGSTGLLYRKAYRKELIVDVPPSFADEFARSTFLKISDGKRLIVNVPLVSPELGISKTNSCREQRDQWIMAERQKMIELQRQKDEALANRPAGSPAIPKGNPGSWVNSGDYPPLADLEKRQGAVGVILKIGADGLVTDCTIEQSSGHADLDAASCIALRKRALFWPALGVNREPVAGEMKRTVNWVLPKE